ncbi:uncharacterized protein LOC125058109 [Pieris napi]|uniref:uncharacterized protein LOC125058109 n=1 Tax=Pieris napi TaxID=78633 RepID=UPI001FBBFA4F|nr:uncharacterized protein LOC125058109 [Pieris napi]
MWFRCYHSDMYPIKTILHLDNDNEVLDTIDNIQEPNAHSTILESAHPSTNVSLSASRKTCPSGECSNNIGDISHLPRTPPVPGTYTIPSIMNKSVGTNDETENLFGMIKLTASDVCYTNGTIEWVGRKRSFPINSGFKILKDNKIFHGEPVLKKVRKINSTFTIANEKFKECDCADVLPTVNAIVDHLNALHEAVDIVDLRLNTLEDVIGRNE